MMVAEMTVAQTAAGTAELMSVVNQGSAVVRQEIVKHVAVDPKTGEIVQPTDIPIGMKKILRQNRRQQNMMIARNRGKMIEIVR